jgi:hypothetical protein
MLQWKKTTVPGGPVTGTGSGLRSMIESSSALGTTQSR